MSRVVSFRLSDEQMRRVRPLCRRFDRSPGELAARLLEEAIRQSEITGIGFRDSPRGREAYVSGTTLAVWEVVWIHRCLGSDRDATANYLQWDPARVQAALNYAEAYPEEIDEAVEEQTTATVEGLRRKLPGLEVFDPWSSEASGAA